MGEQRTNNTDIVRRSNISRRTWYRLLNADIEEAKLSTLIKLSNTLNTSVTQLLQVYFNGSPIHKLARHPSKAELSTSHQCIGTNLPSNSLVNKNQKFTKTWSIQNRSKENWVGLQLKCLDDQLRVLTSENGVHCEVYKLTSTQSCYIIPNTNIGETTNISVNFTAPDKLGSTLSHWAFFKDDEQLKGPAYPVLDCLVKVINIE